MPRKPQKLDLCSGDSLLSTRLLSALVPESLAGSPKNSDAKYESQASPSTRGLYTPRGNPLDFLRRPLIFSLLALLTGLLLICSPQGAIAQNDTVATLYASEGSVSVRRVGTSSWEGVNTGANFREGDTIRTGKDGKAAVEFVDGALVRLGRYSALTFEKVTAAGNPSVSQTEGKAYFFSRGAKREPEIKTRHVNAAIFGTELVVDVSADSTTIDVLHGSVNASNSKGSVSLALGDRAVTRLNEAPTKSILVRPADSVQWMINFPFVLVEGDLLASPDPGCGDACAQAIKAILADVSKGDTLLTALDKHDQPLSGTARGSVLRAVADWRVGNPSGARAALLKAPAGASPTDRALRDIVLAFTDLVEGNPQGAQAKYDAAKAARPGMVNSAILESYVLQSKGDLDDALEVIEQARAAHPKVASLYDREAELMLSFDRYADATQLLNERRAEFGASSMNSILAGFAALSRHDFDDAQANFVQAQREDPSQSLAYLGQALVKVNDREYGETKELLSKAVQLDPAVASYRSYLGKLFFDDEHSDAAREEYNAAIELDKNDPTAYLYRSYVDVAQNDVIGGLRDVEKSIALNNNRAVYRSTLLLDRDLAVRGAGLARVFNELGFSDIARVEAIKSISDDYGNYSAHRLLGDSYNSILDAEARFSEERIANLLSPLSFNIFNSIGESTALGDYNALFDKKESREAFQAVWQSNQNQVGGELLATGKTDSFGYLFRYAPYYANSSNPNPYHSSANTVRGALQYELTPDDRFVLEGNFRASTQNNETTADGTSSYESEGFHAGDVSLGYNHRFSTNLTFLAQAGYARDSNQFSFPEERTNNLSADFTAPDTFFYAPLSLQANPKDVISQNNYSAQLIYTSKYIDSVTGVQGLYFDSSRRENSPVSQINVCEGGADPACQVDVQGDINTSSSANLSSGDVYEYLSFKIPQTANLTLGLTATTVEYEPNYIPPYLSATERESKLSPKIGLVTTPTSWLTTRAAYFQNLSKSDLTDLSSLEPTLVGGLNQDFNNLSGAESENYAFGLDAKAPNKVYVGAQYTHRNLKEPIGYVEQYSELAYPELSLVGLENFDVENSYAEDQIFRGYLYSVLSDSTVFTADTLMDWFNLQDPGEEPATIISRRVRLGARQYYGKHLSFTVSGTYRNQNISGLPGYLPDESQAGGGFWLFDTAVSYRFPEQHGNVFFRVDNILNRDFDYNTITGVENPLLEGRSFILGINYNFF